jgi:hypothetical protein
VAVHDLEHRGFSAYDSRANGEANGPAAPALTARARPFSSAATVAENCGTNGVDRSTVAMNASVAPASTPPGSLVLTPCAIE